MEHYPDAGNASQAMQRIKEIETGNYKPADFAEKPQKAQPEILNDLGDLHNLSDTDDLSLNSDFWADDSDKKPAASAGTGAAKNTSEVSFDSEFGDFFTDSEEPLHDFDDFSMDDAAEPKITDKLNEASTLFGQKRFSEASNIYKSIVDSGEFIDDSDMAQAHLGLGQCSAKLGKNKEALQIFNNILKGYPSAACLDEVYFGIGDIFLASAQKDRALQYFKKAASIQSGGPVAKKAAMRIKELQGQ